MSEHISQIHTFFPQYYRAIFISDVHLGFPGCSAQYLLNFLRSTKCDYLYLVGDIIDVWQMKKRIYWPQAHNDVIRAILGKAKHGTKIIYIPGNHDELMRDFEGIVSGNLEIHDEYIHITKNGKRFLIMHGDQFDGVIKSSSVLAIIGSSLYEILLKLNLIINFIRRKMGFSYWSLANVLKQKVNRAVSYISNYEMALSHAAIKNEVDGIISGHIHRAEITRIRGIIYCNCGDWVESCTALVECHDGSMELLHWTERKESLKKTGIAA